MKLEDDKIRREIVKLCIEAEDNKGNDSSIRPIEGCLRGLIFAMTGHDVGWDCLYDTPSMLRIAKIPYTLYENDTFDFDGFTPHGHKRGKDEGDVIFIYRPAD